jgi:dihydroorotate dehydrogenase (NAD+) catalytic subunit
VPDLSVQLGPLRLAHPLVNASGTMELLELAEMFGAEFLEHPPVSAYVPKTITLEPRTGNRPPRIFETSGGIINAIGLSGPGLEAFVTGDLPRLLALPCPLIISVGGFSVPEYVSLAAGLRGALDESLSGDWISRVGLELNVSCPNVHSACISIGSDPGETSTVVAAVRAEWPGLLVVKLTPNVADITLMGRAAEAAGADAIAAVNTYQGLALDRTTLKPYLGNTTGGLSGPAIKPLALRAVFDLFKVLRIPIIGMGGVAGVQDVLEFMACGARVVAVGSCAFRDPCLVRVLASGLSEVFESRNYVLDNLVGRAHHDA